MFNDTSFVLPDFCKNSSVLMLVLATELSAIVITLIKYENSVLQNLGGISLYFQWCSLLSCALLCSWRKVLNNGSASRAILASLVCLLTPFLLIEFGTQWVFNYYQDQPYNFAQFGTRFLAALILSLFVLRFFALMSLLELRNKAEMNQRILALQSRIKPHFLFNSLNTISELTQIDPENAEEAINSLSLLFRASLENERRFHSLENEVNLCKRYIDLERWRLGDKLRVVWQEDVKDSKNIETPKLILQPLIENAIIHGVQTSGVIDIEIDIRSTKSHLSLMITNVKGSGSDVYAGHGIAVENIKERLFVLYDDQQAFRIKESSEGYSVIVRFPKKLLTADRI